MQYFAWEGIYCLFITSAIVGKFPVSHLSPTYNFTTTPLINTTLSYHIHFPLLDLEATLTHCCGGYSGLPSKWKALFCVKCSRPQTNGLVANLKEVRPTSGCRSAKI